MASIDQITNELRAIALGTEPGSLIGTEDALTKRFGVSAPTLRKAIRQLEHEEVVDVRRGMRGGFFATRPSLQTATRVAGIFLGGHPESIDDAPRVFEALVPVLVDAVLASDRLNELQRFAEAPREPLPHQAYLRLVYEFSSLLHELADNLPLRLCLSILFQIGVSIIVEGKSLDPAGQSQHQQAQAALARALIAGDRDASIRHYRITGNMVLNGIKSTMDLQRRARASAG